MGTLLAEIADLCDRYHERKEDREKNKCSDCGFWVACKPCSERYSRVDLELRIKEGKPVDEYLLKQYGPNAPKSN